MLKLRNRIFDNSENIVLNWCHDFAIWYIRRTLHNNLDKYKVQLKESLGYLPTEAELRRFAELKFDTKGVVYVMWKGRYLFEWKG